MSVEGMWCFVNGDVVSNELTVGGILILDTHRIYGGDGDIAHIGSYETAGTTVRGEVESFPYNPSYRGLDAFGDRTGPARKTLFEATLSESGSLFGFLERGGVTLRIRLQKLRDLP